MKFRNIIYLSLLFTGLLSCSLEDPIESTVTEYPVFEITDGPYLYWELGTTFEDPGVTAKINEEPVEVSIDGEVDTSVPGVYVLKYTAINSDEIPSSVIRYVAVGNKEIAAGRDLSGSYAPKNTVTKITDGFYLNSDILPENKIKALMVDLGNGSLIIPSQSSAFGTVYVDPSIDPDTYGILNADGSFTLAQMISCCGIFTRTFIKL